MPRALRRREIRGLEADSHDRADLEVRQRLDQVLGQAGHGVGDHTADARGHGRERGDLVGRLPYPMHRELALELLEHERPLRADDGDLDGHDSSLCAFGGSAGIA